MIESRVENRPIGSPRLAGSSRNRSMSIAPANSCGSEGHDVDHPERCEPLETLTLLAARVTPDQRQQLPGLARPASR
jgi:hypothetical protein